VGKLTIEKIIVEFCLRSRHEEKRYKLNDCSPQFNISSTNNDRAVQSLLSMEQDAPRVK